MRKYYCLNQIAKEGLERFSEEYERTEDICEADGILVRSASMHEMELPPKLLAVARAGAGVNNIPLERCAQQGIVVFNTPGANANGVKELVIAGMLLACRNIAGGIRWVEQNREDAAIASIAEKEKKNFAGIELAGKKLGIIGLGAIGVKVANAARHLGMEVLGYDPYVSVDAAWNLSRDVRHVLDMREIYGQCDFITIHVPLLDSTKGMIGKEAVSEMKDGVILLNFSRDLLVDERAVLEGIRTGKVRRYVSDFPNPVTAGQKGCIVIPHLGASTEESEINCAAMAVRQLRDYLENGNIKNSVNFPDCDMGVCASASRVVVFHKNIANMIAKFSAVVGGSGLNIANMMNRSKGAVACTMMDLESDADDGILERLGQIEGVFRVRKVV
ncbi:MAG: 3-phosphoglycerate dehydrogenase [Firmicutes bacterium]|nr:3-phosphoglycerate dehydrogenase [Bacillota bacterium]